MLLQVEEGDRRETDRSESVLEIIATVRRERNMVKVEPDLPEPPAEPATLFARAADSLLMEGGLLARCIKVDNP